MDTNTGSPTLPIQNQTRNNIIAIASGKGGVGKTWFSISLAGVLAKMEQRVLLFDGDLGLANLDIQLGLMAKHDLGNVLAGRVTLNQAVMSFSRGEFDIIPGRSGSGSFANLGMNQLRNLAHELSILAQQYDTVIIDLGAGVENTVRKLSHVANKVIVIITDEPTSLTDGYALIKLTHSEKAHTDLAIVANMAHSTKSGERTYGTLLKACQGFLKISPPLLGIIRRDQKVPESIRAQVPLLVRYPNSTATEDVESIARAIVDSKAISAKIKK